MRNLPTSPSKTFNSIQNILDEDSSKIIKPKKTIKLNKKGQEKKESCDRRNEEACTAIKDKSIEDRKALLLGDTESKKDNLKKGEAQEKSYDAADLGVVDVDSDEDENSEIAANEKEIKELQNESTDYLLATVGLVENKNPYASMKKEEANDMQGLRNILKDGDISKMYYSKMGNKKLLIHDDAPGWSYQYAGDKKGFIVSVELFKEFIATNIVEGKLDEYVDEVRKSQHEIEKKMASYLPAAIRPYVIVDAAQNDSFLDRIESGDIQQLDKPADLIADLGLKVKPTLKELASKGSVRLTYVKTPNGDGVVVSRHLLEPFGVGGTMKQVAETIEYGYISLDDMETYKIALEDWFNDVSKKS